MEQDTKIDSNSTININDDINIDQEIHIKWFFYTFILIILFNIQ